MISPELTTGELAHARIRGFAHVAAGVWAERSPAPFTTTYFPLEDPGKETEAWCTAS